MRARIALTLSLIVALGLGLPGLAHAQEKPPASGSTGSVGGEPVESGPLQLSAMTTAVGGAAVDIVPAGARATVSITLTNVGDTSASGVALTASAAPASIVDGSATFGTLGPKDEATGTITVVPAEEGCTGSVELELAVTSSLGDQTIPAGFSVACPGVNLYPNPTFKTSDGDDLVEPGERVEISIALANAGRDAATDVRATLSFSDPAITVVNGTATWPDIRGGAQATSTEPFVIRVAEDAPTKQSGCGTGGGPMPVETNASDVSSSSGGSGSSTGSVAPDETVSSDPGASGAGSTPEPAPPAPGGSVEPAPSVVLDGSLIIHASGKTFTVAVGNAVVCAFSEGAAQGGGPAPLGGTRDKSLADARLAGTKGEGGRSTPIGIAAVLLFAAAGLLVRYRVARASR